METRTDGDDSRFDFPEEADGLTVFMATPIASYCYLFEALLWMAFQRLPLAFASEESADVRWENDFEDVEPCVEIEPANDEECRRAGLPPSPEYAVFARGDYISSPENIERLLRLTFDDPEEDKVHRQKFERELAEAKEHFAKCDVWERQFEQCLDLHKSRLYVALREGKVLGVGKRLPPTADESFPTEDLKHEDFWKWAKQGWMSIPAASWLSTGIDWERSWVKTTCGSYALVLVPTAVLLDLFPAERQPPWDAFPVGDGYLIPDPKAPTQASKRGRPAFNWDELHLELAKRLISNGLPKKQEALIAEMQAWCLQRWGRPVGRSTLLAKISPYYSTFVR